MNSHRTWILAQRAEFILWEILCEGTLDECVKAANGQAWYCDVVKIDEEYK